MAKTSNNIIRYSGETLPSKSTIKINEVPMDLSDGWRVEVRYKVPEGTMLPGGHGTAVGVTVLVIDGVLTDPQKGKFNIYPHARLTGEKVLTPDKYMTSELRYAKVEAAGGLEDGIPAVNQVWDDAEAEFAGGSLLYPFYTVRVKEFDDGYLEEQVHNVGNIQIASRWLS